MLTATQIATEIGGITPAQVNQLLIELGFMRKAEEKGYILNRPGLGKQLMHKANRTPYIMWHPNILENRAFIAAVNAFKVVSVDTPLVVEKKEEVKVEEAAPKKEAFKFDRGTFKAEFRTMDGHFVRSKSEVIVDNWFYMNGIVHAYEKRLPIEEEVYSDFFIPGANIYIEFWGYENDPKYLARKEKKISLYEKYGLKLVQLDDNDVKDIDDILPLKLLQHGYQVI